MDKCASGEGRGKYVGREGMIKSRKKNRHNKKKILEGESNQPIRIVHFEFFNRSTCHKYSTSLISVDVNNCCSINLKATSLAYFH